MAVPLYLGNRYDLIGPDDAVANMVLFLLQLSEDRWPYLAKEGPHCSFLMWIRLDYREIVG